MEENLSKLIKNYKNGKINLWQKMVFQDEIKKEMIDYKL